MQTAHALRVNFQTAQLLFHSYLFNGFLSSHLVINYSDHWKPQEVYCVNCEVTRDTSKVRVPPKAGHTTVRFFSRHAAWYQIHTWKQKYY